MSHIRRKAFHPGQRLPKAAGRDVEKQRAQEARGPRLRSQLFFPPRLEGGEGAGPQPRKSAEQRRRASVGAAETQRARERAMAMASLRWLVVCGALLLSAAPGRGQRMMGGLQDASVDEEGVQQALKFAMNEYNRASNDKYASRVAEVVRVRKQIVSGVNYFFNVKVGRTTCPKSIADVENCAFHEAPELAKHVTCNFQVYSVPWTNHITLKRNNCT